MGNHRYNRLKSTIFNLWYDRKDWCGTIRAEATASFSSRLLPIRLKADARGLVMSEYLVASLMLLMSVLSWILLESGGASYLLAVGLESPWSSIMRMRVRQVLAVWVFHLMREK